MELLDGIGGWNGMMQLCDVIEDGRRNWRMEDGIGELNGRRELLDGIGGWNGRMCECSGLTGVSL